MWRGDKIGSDTRLLPPNCGLILPSYHPYVHIHFGGREPASLLHRIGQDGFSFFASGGIFGQEALDGACVVFHAPFAMHERWTTMLSPPTPHGGDRDPSTRAA